MGDKQTFDTKTAVQTYLIDKGYDITVSGKSKLNSKLSKHLNGLPRQDGKWLQSDVDFYAKQNWDLKDGVLSKDDMKVSEEIKLEELRYARLKADKIERENATAEGLLIERSKVNRELVARMIQLRKDEKTDNKVKAAEIIELVGGDIEKEKALQKYLNEKTDQRLNKYAKPMRFNVGISELEKEIALIEAEEANAS